MKHNRKAVSLQHSLSMWMEIAIKIVQKIVIMYMIPQIRTVLHWNKYTSLILKLSMLVLNCNDIILGVLKVKKDKKKKIHILQKSLKIQIQQKKVFTKICRFRFMTIEDSKILYIRNIISNNICFYISNMEKPYCKWYKKPKINKYFCQWKSDYCIWQYIYC